MQLEDAIKRCTHFKKLHEKLHELSKCPNCNEYTLSYEAGEYETGIQPYIYCDGEDGECEFTAEANFRGLASEVHSDFDVVLMFAGVFKNEGLEETEKQIGIPWNEFILKEASTF